MIKMVRVITYDDKVVWINVDKIVCIGDREYFDHDEDLVNISIAGLGSICVNGDPDSIVKELYSENSPEFYGMVRIVDYTNNVIWINKNLIMSVKISSYDYYDKTISVIDSGYKMFIVYGTPDHVVKEILKLV